MNYMLTRRQILALMGASSVLPWQTLAARDEFPFRIRTITSGVRMQKMEDFSALQGAADFLTASREEYQQLGYVVQTLRLSTQPLFDYLGDWQASDSLDKLLALDHFAKEQNMMLSLGPVNNADQLEPGFVDWLVKVLVSSSNLSCSLIVASAEQEKDAELFNTAANIMRGVASGTEGGEGNFRFVASAWCPPGTPFFPASYFTNESFSLGLESADLLYSIINSVNRKEAMGKQLTQEMQKALRPLQEKGQQLEAKQGRPFLGIDTSPAPNLDVSIGRAIEALSGKPFGSPGTLAACAAITDVLKTLDIRACGYSGLMLPILEDTTLARRAMEGRYSVSDLLLYSSVCGTGLDVVPLPGDISRQQLAALVGDVAALAGKYKKPLSARLFPVPGKKAGDMVRFNNPYLTDAMVMDVS